MSYLTSLDQSLSAAEKSTQLKASAARSISRNTEPAELLRSPVLEGDRVGWLVVLKENN